MRVVWGGVPAPPCWGGGKVPAPPFLSDKSQITKEIEKSGFSLIPPEITILCRKLYNEQPTGEWLRFATPLESMKDSDGVPHLPKIGKALGFYFIETYWAYPKAIFHPHNEFVMMIK